MEVLKLRSRIEYKLRSPSYYIIISAHNQSLIFFIIAKDSKCILSFMGGSDLKICTFENSQNVAQISEKVPTLHK